MFSRAIIEWIISKLRVNRNRDGRQFQDTQLRQVECQCKRVDRRICQFRLLNRTPVFSNVIDYSNDFVVGTENEIINSIEMGVWSKHPWSMNFNCYYTDLE